MISSGKGEPLEDFYSCRDCKIFVWLMSVLCEIRSKVFV